MTKEGDVDTEICQKTQTWHRIPSSMLQFIDNGSLLLQSAKPIQSHGIDTHRALHILSNLAPLPVGLSVPSAW